MDNAEIKAFIKENADLFWYTPEAEKETISEEFLVETILNHGDIDAVRRLFQILGIKKVSRIFFNSINLSERRKGNYHETTINFFTLVFEKYTH